jgi:hypothetical protein
VYRSCIHCCGDLGSNEVIEPFPIGGRLAFDAAKGRLWVICPHCARWNLTPLEERWEAVEECERRFRGLRLRAQTANIGHARLAEGLDLVRVGAPLRPEFAAWRYGREFSRRRTHYVLGASAVALAVAGVAIGGIYAGAAFALPHLGAITFQALRSLGRVGPTIELPRGPGRAWSVDSFDTMVLPDSEGGAVSGWRLSIKHHFGRTDLRGDEAHRWLSYLLARVNRSGGSDSLVGQAVAQLEQKPGESMLLDLARESNGLWSVDGPLRREFEEHSMHGFQEGNEWERHPNRASLARLTPPRRLALEMALHESTETRAVAGELSALEAAWREAEEIAGIADELLPLPGSEEHLERLRRDGKV